MKHKYYDGMIYHKRYSPKKHEFKYKFFMLDMNLSIIEKLKNRFFSINSFNLFSFSSKDHFGKSDDFNENVKGLLKSFSLNSKDFDSQMRFVTLPRIMGFVFNPISLIILFKNSKPSFMLAEVHNYNGGRVVYPVKLQSNDGKTFKGESTKDMYVSPFFKRDGDYRFSIRYEEENFSLNILLFENEQKVLSSTFQGKTLSFNEKNILKLFFKHTFLTFWVVTRTIYETIKLKIKGLSWNKPLAKDQVRRY